MASVTTSLDRSAVQPERGASLWSDAFGRLRKNRLAIVGLVMVIMLLAVGVFGPFLAPHPYQVQDTAAVRAYGGPLPPGSPDHILGTDQLGRDLLSRLLDGARISVTVAFVVQIVVIIIGVPLGATAGWVGGRLDNVLMRFTGTPSSARRWTGCYWCSSRSASRRG
jgi:oligopeptide transport system permease protein